MERNDDWWAVPTLRDYIISDADWGEEHKYVNASGTFNVQNMSAAPFGPSFVQFVNNRYKVSSSNLWVEFSGLKGVGRTGRLFYKKSGGGGMQAIFLRDRVIEVTIP